MKEQLQRQSLQEELKLFVLECFWHVHFAAVENSIRISFLNSFFFSSKKGLNKDRNSIGRLSLLCLVSRSLCELHECKKVTLS